MVYENIRNLREDRDLKQETVAKHLNISQTTYSRYESGSTAITAEVLVELSHYYDVPVDYLLYVPSEPDQLNLNFAKPRSRTVEAEFTPDCFKRIRELRKLHHMSQSDVARSLGIEQSTYSKYERGAIPISVKALSSLADLYKVSIDYIVGRTNKLH